MHFNALKFRRLIKCNFIPNRVFPTFLPHPFCVNHSLYLLLFSSLPVHIITSGLIRSGFPLTCVCIHSYLCIVYVPTIPVRSGKRDSRSPADHRNPLGLGDVGGDGKRMGGWETGMRTRSRCVRGSLRFIDILFCISSKKAGGVNK